MAAQHLPESWVLVQFEYAFGVLSGSFKLNHYPLLSREKAQEQETARVTRLCLLFWL